MRDRSGVRLLGVPAEAQQLHEGNEDAPAQVRDELSDRGTPHLSAHRRHRQCGQRSCADGRSERPRDPTPGSASRSMASPRADSSVVYSSGSETNSTSA